VVEDVDGILSESTADVELGIGRREWGNHARRREWVCLQRGQKSNTSN
jgi:hypothetical protein